VHAEVGRDLSIHLGPLEYLECACRGRWRPEHSPRSSVVRYLECACSGRWIPELHLGLLECLECACSGRWRPDHSSWSSGLSGECMQW
jgi:hypothetical protein